MKSSLLLNLCCAVVAGANAFGDYVVNSTGDQPWSGNRLGLCQTAPFNNVCTLRAAIQASNAIGGTNITFNIPTSDPNYINGTWFILPLSALPDITASININGPGSTKLEISGFYGQMRILNVTTGGTVTLSGVTVAFGYTSNGQYGAGIQIASNGTVNLTSCAFIENYTLADSSGGGGGAIFNATGGTINITDCTFESNSAADTILNSVGGAIWNKTGTIHVSNSTFHHNQSSARGGAIWNESGIVTVSGSTFSRNGAAFGGGIGSEGGTVSITNSTFYANIANRFAQEGDYGIGGAIDNFGTSVLNLTNSTITANFSNYAGGGIYNDNTSGAVANIKSTIVAGNFGGTLGANSPESPPAPDVYGPFNSSGFNLIGAKDGSTGFTAATDKKGTVASPLNPKLDPKGLRNNGGPTQTVALVSGSPAIDKGTSVGLTGTLTTDQRGFHRTVNNGSIPNANGGDGTDIGAYEFGAQ